MEMRMGVYSNPTPTEEIVESSVSVFERNELNLHESIDNRIIFT